MASFTLKGTCSGLVIAAVLLGGLTACAAETSYQFAEPTMAPEQSVSDACGISRAEIERIVQEAESQLLSELEQASSAVAAGEIPDLGTSGFTVLDDALAALEQQLGSEEVLAGVAEMRSALQGFETLNTPSSLIEAPAFLVTFSGQVNDVVEAGRKLQALCAPSS